MRRRCLLSIVIFCVGLLCAIGASCSEIDALVDDKMIFSSDGDGGAVLVRAEGYYGKDVVIPRYSPDGEPVVGIGAEAFIGSGALSVTIPSGVRYIGDRAFASCSAVRSFCIPNTVSMIGMRVFEGCTSLFTLVVESGGDAYYSVDNCIIETDTGVLVAGCNGSTIPKEGVFAISGGAFYGASSLSSAVIPAGVVLIGEYAFYGCEALTELSLPLSLGHIGAYAFNGCSSLTRVAVPYRVDVLNEGVFRNCTSLVTAELSEGLIEIGKLAFQGCSALVDPVLPSTLVTLGGLSFSGCASFVHLKIPKTLIEIGDGAFSYCDLLWGIKVENDNPVFRADGNCLIRREDGVIVLGTRGSVIPADESVTAIADRAFFGAKQFRSAMIPANIRSIGKEAFYGCTYLDEVMIDGSASIGDGAFAKCVNLKLVYISETVETVGKELFMGCRALEKIAVAHSNIPDGWSSDWIGNEAVAEWGSDRPVFAADTENTA